MQLPLSLTFRIKLILFKMYMFTIKHYKVGALGLEFILRPLEEQTSGTITQTNVSAQHFRVHFQYDKLALLFRLHSIIYPK